MKAEDVRDEWVEIICVAGANWGRAADGVPLLKSSDETCFADEYRERMRAALAAVIPLVQAAEREACAEVVEQFVDHADDGEIWVIRRAVDALRARNPA